MSSHGFEYGGPTILSHPIVVEAILPFVLVFTLVFAILQKTKVLGDGKRQIDALVALSIGLIVISFGNAIGIMIQLAVFLAVMLVIVLVLMLLVGSLGKGEFSESFGDKFKTWVGGVLGISVVVAVLIITGAWDYIYDEFVLGGEGDLIVNGIFIIALVVALAAVWAGAGKGKGGKD
tara:strand:+ start:300 stop:830 length:531 start_codon:yes stop_codon:yes gene_type:complete